MLNLTEYETNSPISVKVSDIDVYRGNSDFTSIYLKDGSSIYVKEDFDLVDELFENHQNEICN